MRTQGGDARLHSNERGLRGSQPCPHLDLGLQPRSVPVRLSSRFPPPSPTKTPPGCSGDGQAIDGSPCTIRTQEKPLSADPRMNIHLGIKRCSPHQLPRALEASTEASFPRVAKEPPTCICTGQATPS